PHQPATAVRQPGSRRGIDVRLTRTQRYRALRYYGVTEMLKRKVNVIGMVLAGGRGSRLHPLTWKRTKPAVPFGSKYRIIDFALNNMINSGIFGIFVLTQFKAQSFTEHIQ